MIHDDGQRLPEGGGGEIAARTRSVHAGRLVADLRPADDLALIFRVPPSHDELARLIGGGEPERHADELLIAGLAPFERRHLRANLGGLAEIERRVCRRHLVLDPRGAMEEKVQIAEVVLIHVIELRAGRITLQLEAVLVCDLPGDLPVGHPLKRAALLAAAKPMKSIEALQDEALRRAGGEVWLRRSDLAFDHGPERTSGIAELDADLSALAEQLIIDPVGLLDRSIDQPEADGEELRGVDAIVDRHL